MRARRYSSKRPVQKVPVLLRLSLREMKRGHCPALRIIHGQGVQRGVLLRDACQLVLRTHAEPRGEARKRLCRVSRLAVGKPEGVPGQAVVPVRGNHVVKNGRRVRRPTVCR